MILHLANGETTVAGLEAAGIGGEKHACDDVFLWGPVRGGLRDEQSWQERAEYLEAWASLPADRYLGSVQEREQVLVRAGEYEEVVVWSEEDLLCQVGLWWLLERLSAAVANVSLVLPRRRRLGEAAPGRLQALFDQREAVTSEQVQWAGRAWDAYCAETAEGLEGLLEEEVPLPWAHEAIRLHLERFPTESDGLTLVERTVLRLLEGGPLPFSSLFRFFGDDQRAGALGMGDHWFAAELRDMERYGLIAVDGGASNFEDLGRWMLRITLRGRDALADGADGVQFERWLGGCHVVSR